jgi:hypothetical protein
VLAVLDHFYRSAIYGESERPLAQLNLTGIAATPRGASSARLKLTRRLSSSGAMIAAAPAGAATADKYATYIEQIPAEDGPGMFNNLNVYLDICAHCYRHLYQSTCTRLLLLPLLLTEAVVLGVALTACSTHTEMSVAIVHTPCKVQYGNTSSATS